MTVFVSYSSRDEAPVQKLLSAFKLAHEQVWWDEELGGGESWWRKILEQIRECDVFVFALSQNSLGSKSCQAELGYAQGLRKPVLPVQIGRVESMRVNPFAATHVIDYRNPDVDTGIRLIADVRLHRARKPPLPDPLPPEPAMPYEYLMRLKSDVSGPQLIPQRQLQLLEEVKARLNEDGADDSARADYARLLYALRRRSDTTADTRAEIDTMLDSLGWKARRFSRKWMLAGAALLIAVVVAVVMGFVTVSGRHGSTLVTASKLAAILLTNEEVDEVLGAMDSEGSPIDVKTYDKKATVKPPQCLGVFYNANDAVYKDSGYSDSRNQPLKVGKPNTIVIYQSAIRFRSPDQASKFVRASAENWKSCANQLVEVFEEDGMTSSWRFAPLVDNGSQIAQTVNRVGGNDYACQHVIRAESNVVIEVNACDDRVGDEAIRIAEKMAAKVPDLTRT